MTEPSAPDQRPPPIADGPRLRLARSRWLAETFRAVLDAVSRPGTPQRIAASHYTYPTSGAPVPTMGVKEDLGRLGTDASALSVAAIGALCVLSDGDAPVWLAPDVDRPATRRRLRLQGDVGFARKASGAAFLAGPWASLAHTLPDARRGAAERPDLSATLIVEATRVSTTPRTNALGLLLSGPGVPPEAPMEIWIEGVDHRLSALMAENAQSFPMGVDVLITAGSKIVGLPRSVRATALQRSERAMSA